MTKIYMPLIASAFLCNLLGAAAIDYRDFYRAIARKDIEKVKKFFRKNVNIDIKYPSDGCTPLHLASIWGHVELVHSFLIRGAAVNVKDIEEKTSLHYAVLNGNANLVRLLLEFGAIDEKDGSGRTAVEMAQKNGHNEIAQLIASWNPNDGTEIKEPVIE